MTLTRLYPIATVIYCVIMCVFVVGSMLLGGLSSSIITLLTPILYGVLTVATIIGFYKVDDYTKSGLVLKYVSSVLILGTLIGQVYFLMRDVLYYDIIYISLIRTLLAIAVTVLTLMGILSRKRSAS